MRTGSIRRFLKGRIKNFFISKADQDLLLKYKQNSCFPPGHFYSPIVNVVSIKSRENEIWPEITDKPSEIDLNTGRQIELLQQFKKYYRSEERRVGKEC